MRLHLKCVDAVTGLQQRCLTVNKAAHDIVDEVDAWASTGLGG